MLTIVEYIDITNMMTNIGMYEMENSVYYYTWSNNHVACAIYSSIDRVLGNMDWFQNHLDVTLNIIPLVCLIMPFYGLGVMIIILRKRRISSL